MQHAVVEAAVARLPSGRGSNYQYNDQSAARDREQPWPPSGRVKNYQYNDQSADRDRQPPSDRDQNYQLEAVSGGRGGGGQFQPRAGAHGWKFDFVAVSAQPRQQPRGLDSEWGRWEGPAPFEGTKLCGHWTCSVQYKLCLQFIHLLAC